MFGFEKYKHLGGRPRLGIHRHRIPLVDLAVVDVLAVFLVAYLCSLGSRISFGVWLVGWFVLGVMAHALFEVPTRLNQALSLEKKS